MRLAHITDLHVDFSEKALGEVDTRRNAARVLDDIVGMGIDEVVVTGDIAERSAAKWFMDSLRDRGLHRYIVLGNHDARGVYRKLDTAIRDRPYYRIDMEGFGCLFLDSSRHRIDEKQLRWLAEQTKDATQDLLVFVHHPILDCGNTVMDRKFPLKNRDAAAELLERSGRGVTVFCGHYHTEARIEAGNIVQYVTPSTLFQLKKDGAELELESAEIGYRIVTIEAGRYSTEVRYLP